MKSNVATQININNPDKIIDKMQIFLNFSGIVYTLMIMAVFFLKPKTNSNEQKIYGGILVVALFELIIGLFSTYTIYHDTSSFYTNLVGRLFLFTTLAWIALFTIYTINISKKCNQKNFNSKF